MRPLGSTVDSALRLEVAGDATAPVFLERAGFSGTGTPPVGFVTPLNLYSNPETRVDILLAINQPVNPSSQNINNQLIRLEFLLSSGPDDWQDFPADIILERNCAAAGAEIRIIPLGPFPQAREMRVVIEPEFEDLIGSAEPRSDSRLREFHDRQRRRSRNYGGG